MPKSSALRLQDIRNVAAIVGECRDLGDHANGWNAHLAQRVAGLVGADFAGCGQADGVGEAVMEPLGMGDWGWENGIDRATWLDSISALRHDPFYTPLHRRYFEHLAGTDGISMSRTDLMTDHGWYKSWVYERINLAMGVDHFLWCYRSLPRTEGTHSGFILCRTTGAKDFTAREKELVREVHTWIAPLVGGALAGYHEPSPTKLTPRARLVLKCLLEGDGDKLIGLRLGLTRNTVNQYAKEIYRHFGVQSRAELLARWVKRGWGGRFGWTE